MSSIRKIVLICLILGRAFAENGLTDKEILIGISHAETGPNAYLSNLFDRGADSVIHKFNREGGVAGRIIRTVKLNDQGVPNITAQNTKRLIFDYKVFALFNYYGLESVMTFFSGDHDHDIPFIAPISVLNPISLAEKNVATTVYNRFDLIEESEFIQKDLQTKKINKILVISNNDQIGKKITDFYTLSGFSVEILLLDSNGKNLENLKDIIANKGIEAIVYAAQLKWIKNFGQELKQNNIILPHYFYSMAINFNQMVEGQYKEEAILIARFPMFEDFENAIIKEYVSMNKEISWQGLEGFLNAKLLVTSLKECGKDLSRSCLVEAARKLKNNFQIPLSKLHYQNSKLQVIK